MSKEYVAYARDKYQTPSLATFQAYDDPVVLEKGKGCHIWDKDGNKYVDLLG
jgi:alanine-glyoxylate transaminase/(R)-3-amino-2-methylpropionate-pyruvate transaminase